MLPSLACLNTDDIVRIVRIEDCGPDKMSFGMLYLPRKACVALTPLVVLTSITAWHGTTDITNLNTDDIVRAIHCNNTIVI